MDYLSFFFWIGKNVDMDCDGIAIHGCNLLLLLSTIDNDDDDYYHQYKNHFNTSGGTGYG
jgi:hypothetical protein